MVCVDALAALCTIPIRCNRSGCFRNIGYMDMTESKEREAYRKACRHYNYASDHCSKLSHGRKRFNLPYAPYVEFVDFVCTPDCKCERMMVWDKMNKDK